MLIEADSGLTGDSRAFPIKGNAETGAVYVELPAGGTSGTQYTEDAAAASNPVGNAVNLVRQDTPASEVSANGDNIAQRGTAYGAAFTQILTSSGSFIDSFGGGTQYTEGDTDATITGTAVMFESNTTTSALSAVSATTPLPIALPSTQQTNLSNIDSATSRLISSAGPKAAGSALATTALQVGGTYNTSLPTMTNTQEGGFQLDVNGKLITSIAGVDIGSLTETAPATDTASSGLNGRLQRVAQRITSLIALLPSALTAGGNLKVAIQEALVAGTALIGKVGIDQTTPGTTDSVTTKTKAHSATVTITRPSDTTAYTAGDVIGDTGGSAIFTFANMVRSGGGEVVVTSIELEIDVAAMPSGMTGFNIRLYNASPTAIADNAAWDLPSGDRGKYLGRIVLATPVDEGSTLFIDNDNVNKQIALTGTSLFVELQTIGAYTPTSASVKRLTIHTIEV